VSGECHPPDRILGVDPGLNVTGYGVIELDDRARGGIPGVRLLEAGVIRSRPRAPIESRLRELFEGIREVIEQHRPGEMALEQLFSHYDRPRTAILMGHARGVICLAAAISSISVTHYEPTRVKRMMTGNGRAPKQQIQLAVKAQLGLSGIPEPADVADALALALCHHASVGQLQ
jgi:crossover junction endodeoxyribonuclease RuvC